MSQRFTPASSVVDGFMDFDAVAALSASRPGSVARMSDVAPASEAAAEAADNSPQEKKSKKEKKKKKRDRDEDDDEDSSHKKHKSERKDKKKKREKVKRSRFIADVASEGSDDEESDELSQHELEDDADAEYIERLKNYESKPDLFAQLADEDEEAIAQRYKDRVRDDKNRSAQQEMIQGAQRFGPDCLPRSTDPKVFAVKVRPGTARIVVARMVNKCHAYLHGNNDDGVRQDLGIMSIFSVDHVREWIYLESHRRRFVEQALNGMEHVFRYRITEVDQRELMQLLARQDAQEEDTIKPKQMVRVKFGPYKGDVALVQRVLEGGRKAEVKIVPREDFVNKAFAKQPAKGGMVFPQKFFVPQNALGVTIRDSGESIWGDLHFDSEGYLIKEFSTRQLTYGKKLTQPPSIDELAMFYKNDRARIDDTVRTHRQSGLSSTVTGADYRLNDMIRVIHGPTSGTIGRIVDIFQSKKQLLLESNVGGTKLETLVEFSKVTKFFPDGTHINIEHGKHAGDSGTVVCAIGSEHLIFCSDKTRQDFQVRAEDCRRAEVTAVSAHHAGTLQLHSLVHLNTQEVGCIVGFLNDKVKVLTTSGSERYVSSSTVAPIPSPKGARAADSMGNSVARGETVVVARSGVAPLYAGRNAEVAVVYGDSLFLSGGKNMGSSGLFVVKSKQVTLLSGKKKFLPSHRVPPMHVYERPVHPAAVAEVGPRSHGASSSGLEAMQTAFWAPTGEETHVDHDAFE